jgi:hypothetical protein
MSRYLHTTGALEYVEYDGECEVWTFNLDELPKTKYSIQEVYDLFEGWASQVNPCTAARIVLTSGDKSKDDCINLFLTFASVLSKAITTELKEGEKRLAPRTEIMDATTIDFVTIKRFLNYKSNIEYLQIELLRKGKSIITL